MDITKRNLGTAVIADEGHAIVGADVGGILRRLVLFDTFILKSIRLQEFPFVVAALGYDGTMELLKSSAFELQCESVALGQTGQTSVLESRVAKGILPPLSYCISGIDTHDHEEYIHKALQPLHEIPGLGHRQVLALKRAIVGKIVRLCPGFAGKVAAQATSDIVSKPHLVKSAVAHAAKRVLNTPTIPEFRIEVHPIDAEDIRVDTDLTQLLDLDLQATHDIIGQGLLAVGSMGQRFAEMEAHSAVNGFIEDDLPLVYEHLDFLSRQLSPEMKEGRLRRVIELAGLPDFSPALSEHKVNVSRLLEICQSGECREFRNFLGTTDGLSDNEIRERLTSIRSRFGNAIQTAEGKAVRFLTTTGIGLIPGIGLIAGSVASALDTFVLEKILPKSGLVAFVSKLYPSIFEKREL